MLNPRRLVRLAALAATALPLAAAAQVAPPPPAGTPPPWAASGATTASPFVAPAPKPPSPATTTPAPVAAPTPAPVAAPTPAPVAAPTPAPVAAPTPAPVATPTPAPVPATTPAPVAAPAAPPSEPGTYGLSMPSLYGASGNLRVFAADNAPAGSFRFQLTGEAFRASEFLAQGDTNSRVGGRFLLGVSVLDWLEVFATLSGSSNSNDKGSPSLIQVQGDFSFGAKGCYAVLPWLCVGAAGSVQFLTGAGDIAFTGASTTVLLRALASADLTKHERRLPLRLHLNVGGTIDNSDALLTRNFTAVQRFALRVNEGSRVFIGLGVEAPVSRYVTPFLEYLLEAPVGLPTLQAGLADPGASAWPHILSIGARVFPWRQLSLLAAVDVGLTSAGRLGVPAIPPWQVIFGAGWSFDTGERPATTKVVEKVVEKEKIVTREVRVNVPVPTPLPPTTGTLVGVVIDAKSAAPIPDAIVRITAGGEESGVVSDRARGQFRAPEVKPGTARVRVERTGFKTADFEVGIAVGKVAAASFPIEKLAPPPPPPPAEQGAARLEGTRIVIAKQVQFEEGSAKIDGDESFKLLDDVASVLRTNPQVKRRIEGHTDNVGGKAANDGLSKKRAKAVLDYLVSKGVEASRLSSEGYGQRRPLVPNTTAKNKAKNRRVEFVVTDQ